MTEKNNKVLNQTGIVYATDDNYAKHVAVSLVSLYENAKSDELPVVYIIGNHLSKVNIDKLDNVANKYGGKVKYLKADIAMDKLPKDINTANLTVSTYIRLFLAEIMPNDIKKILYLDCDTYICCNILYLLNFDFAGKLIAGIEDTMYPHMKTKIGLHESDRYINAGILLINLEEWRRQNITKEFIKFIFKFNGSVPHLDQGVINGVFRGQIKYMPLRYNVQSPIFAIHTYKRLLSFHGMTSYYPEVDVKLARKNPAIIHFTSFFTGRPWEKGCLHPLRKLYYDAISKTDYAETSYDRVLPLYRRIRIFCFKYFQPVYFILKKL